jgi:hypothetical protein
MDKKKSYSFDEAGRLICSAAMKGIDHLVDRVLPKIAEVLNLTYSDYDQDHLRAESFYVCLWAATKALEGDNPELIESLQNAGLGSLDEMKGTAGRELFYQRWKQYDTAWNQASGGDQSILCVNILAEMFTEGNHRRELVNYWAFIQTSNFVLSLIKAIADLLNEIELKK